MPLQQLYSSSGNKRVSSSNTTFIPPAIQAQEVYDAKSSQISMERCPSQASILSFSKDICRICHCEEDTETPLISPCYCLGSLRYMHQGCLQQWIKSSGTKRCELCKFLFIMHSKVKPFRKWERLDMSGIEQRKIVFSVLFHVVAITCVVWSLYVLIERTSQEVQNGELEWPFWTKLVLVAIGFTGSIVFMYVQCKMYVRLCGRWRTFNRAIYIQNAPQKVVLRDVEIAQPATEFPSESSEKPFLSLSVITTPGSGVITSSSPPGALRADETPPQVTTFSSYSSDTLNQDRDLDEADSLLSSGDPPCNSSLYLFKDESPTRTPQIRAKAPPPVSSSPFHKPTNIEQEHQSFYSPSSSASTAPDCDDVRKSLRSTSPDRH